MKTKFYGHGNEGKKRGQGNTHHEKGQYDDPGEVVERNAPEFLHPMKRAGDVASRMDLANWFIDKENPLTARVAVK